MNFANADQGKVSGAVVLGCWMDATPGAESVVSQVLIGKKKVKQEL